MAEPAWGDWDLPTRNDPYPLFAATRDVCPVQHVTLADGHDAYLVLGYDAARQALKDSRLSKDMLAALDQDPDVMDAGLPGPAFARHMLAVDPPDHTRLRRLVARVRAQPDRGTRTRRSKPSPGSCSTSWSPPSRGHPSISSRDSPTRCRSGSSARCSVCPKRTALVLRRSFRTLFQPWSGSPPREAVAASGRDRGDAGTPRRGASGPGPRRPRRRARHRERRRRPAHRAGVVVEPVPVDRRRPRHDDQPDRQRRRRARRPSRRDAVRA